MLNSFTRRLTRLEDSLRPLKADAGTSLYDALYLSTGAMRSRDGRHVVVVVTDGGDTTSSKKYSDALSSILHAEAVLYPIVIVPITNPAGRNIGGEHALETLSRSSGGRMFYPTIEQLDRTFADILRELRTQYLIGYYPRGPLAGDGKFHRVRLELPTARGFAHLDALWLLWSCLSLVPESTRRGRKNQSNQSPRSHLAGG